MKLFSYFLIGTHASGVLSRNKHAGGVRTALLENQ